jgi:hypothetical protein
MGDDGCRSMMRNQRLLLVLRRMKPRLCLGLGLGLGVRLRKGRRNNA